MAKTSMATIATALLILALGDCDHAAACTLGVVRASASNSVPGYTTPSKVVDFILARGNKRAAKYQSAASLRMLVDLYLKSSACPTRTVGKCMPIRWDYAVFQMLHETNYLGFTGGVRPEHNNFAGIGAKNAGKSGEEFKSIETGVLGHVQHLLMYTGLLIENPVAQRTREVQSFVVPKMKKLGNVTFCDIGREGWSGTDPNEYADKVQHSACAFDKRYCR